MDSYFVLNLFDFIVQPAKILRFDIIFILRIDNPKYCKLSLYQIQSD